MKPMRQVEPLETIWEIPDDLWEKVEPVILEGTLPKPPVASGSTQGQSLTELSFAYVVVANGTICQRLLVTIVLSIVLFSYG